VNRRLPGGTFVARPGSRILNVSWWQAAAGVSMLTLALAQPAGALGAIRTTAVPASGPLAAPVTAVTALESSGLAPVWREDFSGGSVDTMQFTWAQGDVSSLSSYVQPGAIYMGRTATTTSVEQEINHFKQSSSEPLAATLEFDVFSPLTGNGRISLRPERRGDMIHILLGQKNDATTVKFRPIDTATSVNYSEKTGPTRGWAHVVESYEQFDQAGTTMVHQVLAIDGEVQEFTGPSGITGPDYTTDWNSTPDADGWSIEHQSSVSNMGKYVANVRGYQQFLTATDLQARLSGVDTYRAGLADPRGSSGAQRSLQLDTPLNTHGPNAVAYAVATGQAGQFDASYSSGWHAITAYDWTFDDGGHASGRIASHAFATGGTHTATIVVTNEYGTDSRTLSLDLGGGSTNQAPVANGDSYSVDHGGSLAVAAPGVLGNDTDAEHDSLTAAVVAGPSHASAFSLDANGGFSYTPTSTYTGLDSFTYRANDGTVDSNVATVTITVSAGPPPGSITFRGAASGANTGAATLVMQRPAGTAAGDVLVAAVSMRGAPTITSPAGWTLVRRDAKKTSFSQAIFVHVAGGSEPPTYTFSLGASVTAVGTIAAYANVDAAVPIAASGGQVNGKSTAATAPSITPAIPNTQLVGFFMATTKTTFAPAAGMTERAEVVSPGSTSSKVTGELADEAFASGGATGARAATIGKSANSIGQLIALRPA
jgi:hypothetical protein